MTIVLWGMYSFVRMSSVVKELLPFVCLIQYFSVLSHNLVSDGWKFMKLILVYITKV